MKQDQGKTLVSFVRDSYRGEFNNYNLNGLTGTDQFDIFYFWMMGKLFQETVSNMDSFLSELIKEAMSLNAITDTIRLGYEQEHG
ncbi:hypothetical protein BH11BAC3_BH11BAC3_46720 [soil metagenome]